MKNKITILLVLTIALASSAFAKKDTVSIEKAFNNKLIKLDIKGKGGYQGPCIAMQIKSQNNDSMVLYIEAGRRLDSKDSTQQDILVVQDLFVSLASGQEKTVDVTGYCCQAHNGAPMAKSIFFVGLLADKNLYDLGRYLNKAKLSSGSIQNAVWCISDNNELSSVTDDGSEEVGKLRKFLAKLKNIEMPWYNIFYKKEKGMLFSGMPEKVTGNIDYYISDFSQVIVNIRDIKGNIVKSFPVGNTVERGNHTFNLNWDASQMPKGMYYIFVYENGRKLKELPINLK